MFGTGRGGKVAALALAGFMTGVALSFFALLLVQDSWAEIWWLVLAPLATVATTIGGYSLRARGCENSPENMLPCDTGQLGPTA